MSLTQTLIHNLLFLDISGGELLIILIVAFLVFGPQRIPEIARKIGRGMSEIKKASNQIRNEINKEVRDVKNSVSVNLDEPARKANQTQETAIPKTEHNPDKNKDNIL
ncbi:MAG: twin-arginine translocase TatA/TatE family subunit [Bacteroidetes bacterium]|nr:twin-arginine translocase TatA/TatE family subunit [Bacteroidota bacterium]